MAGIDASSGAGSADRGRHPGHPGVDGGRADGPRIAVFAKAPVPGAVKTRLVPLLGADGAARLQGSLARHTLAVAREAQPATLQLWCAPDATHPFFGECAVRYRCELLSQQGADLGERMANAFAGVTPLVLIGTDCPALRASHLAAAWDALRSHDAVVAPAEDGGYVLIGLARPQPALFSGMPWGDASIMARTRKRVADAELTCVELETLWDVDRPDDYRRLEESATAAGVQA
jgi:hypothetical protein